MDLVTSTEAAAIAGITPSTFRTLVASATTKHPVPTPVIAATQGRTSLWRRADIEAWAATRDRQRGARATAYHVVSVYDEGGKRAAHPSDPGRQARTPRRFIVSLEGKGERVMTYAQLVALVRAGKRITIADGVTTGSKVDEYAASLVD